MNENVKNFVTVCKSVKMHTFMLGYDCKATLEMLDGTSTIKTSLDDETYMKARLNDIRNGATTLKNRIDKLLAAMDGDKEMDIVNEYKATAQGGKSMIKMLDSGEVANLQLAVLKDENTNEITVSMTSLTNENTMAILTLQECEELMGTLFEIFDRYSE